MKTITLEREEDSEKLRASLSSGEFPGEEIRRTLLPGTSVTGAALREYYRNGGSGISEEYLDAVEEASKHDPVPDNSWA